MEETGFGMRDPELVFSVSAVEELHSHLIRDDDLERFAMAYCGRSGNRFLATDVYPVEDEDLAQQAREDVVLIMMSR